MSYYMSRPFSPITKIRIHFSIHNTSRLHDYFLSIRPGLHLKNREKTCPDDVVALSKRARFICPMQWKPASTYDPDKFYTSASDKQGRGDPTTVRVPPQAASTIAALVQSQRIPEYTTQADFIRDAVIHRLQTIGEKIESGEILRTVAMVSLLNEEYQAAQAKDDFAVLMQLIETRHTDYLRKGTDRANQYVKQRMADIDSIHPDYQEEYERRLSAKLYPI